MPSMYSHTNRAADQQQQFTTDRSIYSGRVINRISMQSVDVKKNKQTNNEIVNLYPNLSLWCHESAGSVVAELGVGTVTTSYCQSRYYYERQ